MGIRVLYLTGSAVSDFYSDLSLLYARDALTATADPERYDISLAHVSPDGRWRFPTSLDREALDAATPVSLAHAVQRLVALHIDVLVPQMFCLPGMTSYRSLFDVLGVPYVGNAADVMALGAHKARAKAVVAAGGVRVPDGELLRAGQHPSLALPAVVKPADADNSLGVTLVREAEHYDAAVREAFQHSAEVLVEEYVELGREVRCGVVVRDGELVCLPLEEYAVNADTKPVRDHADKINGAADDLRLVAKDAAHAWIVPFEDPVTEAVWQAARAAHVALGCRHYSLFDFRIDPEGRPWFLEASLYCSFAEQSVLCVMARAAGISVPELFAIAVGNARG